METRRSFIQKVLFIIISNIFLFGFKLNRKIYAGKNRKPENVLVVWFSQTGHTERYGKLIAAVWNKMGLKVTSSEIREFKDKNLNSFDLIIVGSPVFYYDIPDYLKKWINSLQQLNEVPVASFVSYGGPEGDQNNAANTILELLAEKGGMPTGFEAFMNIGAYPLVWDEETITSSHLPRNRHLPDKETYKRVRAYADHLIKQVINNIHVEVSKNITLRRFVTIFNPVFWTKQSIQKHAIDKESCIQCGICVKKCPSAAIDLSNYRVDEDKCVLCFGCINNCPQNAVIMMYKDRKLFGFRELLKRKNIKIKEPEELVDVAS